MSFPWFGYGCEFMVYSIATL